MVAVLAGDLGRHGRVIVGPYVFRRVPAVTRRVDRLGPGIRVFLAVDGYRRRIGALARVGAGRLGGDLVRHGHMQLALRDRVARVAPAGRLRHGGVDVPGERHFPVVAQRGKRLVGLLHLEQVRMLDEVVRDPVLPALGLAGRVEGVGRVPVQRGVRGLGDRLAAAIGAGQGRGHLPEIVGPLIADLAMLPIMAGLGNGDGPGVGIEALKGRGPGPHAVLVAGRGRGLPKDGAYGLILRFAAALAGMAGLDAPAVAELSPFIGGLAPRMAQRLDRLLVGPDIVRVPERRRPLPAASLGTGHRFLKGRLRLIGVGVARDGAAIHIAPPDPGDDARFLVELIVRSIGPFMDGNADGRKLGIHLAVLVVGIQPVGTLAGKVVHIQRIAVAGRAGSLIVIPEQLQPHSAGHVGDEAVLLVRHDDAVGVVRHHHRGAGREAGVLNQARPDAEAQLSFADPPVLIMLDADGLDDHAIVVVRSQVGGGQGDARGAGLGFLAAAIVDLVIVVAFIALDVHPETGDDGAIRDVDRDGHVFTLAEAHRADSRGEVGHDALRLDFHADGLAVGILVRAANLRAGKGDERSGVIPSVRHVVGKCVTRRFHRIPHVIAIFVRVAHVDLHVRQSGVFAAGVCVAQRESDRFAHIGFGRRRRQRQCHLRVLHRRGIQLHDLVDGFALIAGRAGVGIDGELVADTVAAEHVRGHGDDLGVAKFISGVIDILIGLIGIVQPVAVLILHADVVLGRVIHLVHGEGESLALHQVRAGYFGFCQSLALLHRHGDDGFVKPLPVVPVVVPDGEGVGVDAAGREAAIHNDVVAIPLFIVVPPAVARILAEQGDSILIRYVAADGKVLHRCDGSLVDDQRGLGCLVSAANPEDQAVVIVGFPSLIALSGIGVHRKAVLPALFQVRHGDLTGDGVRGQAEVEIVHPASEFSVVVVVQHHRELVHAGAVVCAVLAGQGDVEPQRIVAGDCNLAVLVVIGVNQGHHGLVHKAPGFHREHDRFAVDPDVVVGLIVIVVHHEARTHLQVPPGRTVLVVEVAALGQVADIMPLAVVPAVVVIAAGHVPPVAIPHDLKLLGFNGLRHAVGLDDGKFDRVILAGRPGHFGIGLAVEGHGQRRYLHFIRYGLHHGELSFRVGGRILILPGVDVDLIGAIQLQVVRGDRIDAFRVVVIPVDPVVVFVADIHAVLRVARSCAAIRHHGRDYPEFEVRSLFQLGGQLVHTVHGEYDGLIKVAPGTHADNDGLDGLLFARVVIVGHGPPIAVDPLQQSEGIGRGTVGLEMPGHVVVPFITAVFPVFLVPGFHAQSLRAGHVGAQYDLFLGVGIGLGGGEGGLTADDGKALFIRLFGPGVVVADFRLHPHVHAILPVLAQVAGGQQDLSVLRRIDLVDGLVVVVVSRDDADVVVPRAFRGMAEVHAQLLAAGQAVFFVHFPQADAGQRQVLAFNGDGDGVAVVPIRVALAIRQPHANLEGVHAAVHLPGEGTIVVIGIVVAFKRPEAVVEVPPIVVAAELDIVYISFVKVPVPVDIDLEAQSLLGLELGLIDGQRDDAGRGLGDHHVPAVVAGAADARRPGVHVDANVVAVPDAGIPSGIAFLVEVVPVIVSHRHGNLVFAGVAVFAGGIGDAGAVVIILAVVGPGIALPAGVIRAPGQAAVSEQVEIRAVVMDVYIVPDSLAGIRGDLVEGEREGILILGDGVGHPDHGIGNVAVADMHGDGHALHGPPVPVAVIVLPAVKLERVIARCAFGDIDVAIVVPFSQPIPVPVLTAGLVDAIASLAQHGMDADLLIGRDFDAISRIGPFPAAVHVIVRRTRLDAEFDRDVKPQVFTSAVGPVVVPARLAVGMDMDAVFAGANRAAPVIVALLEHFAQVERNGFKGVLIHQFVCFKVSVLDGIPGAGIVARPDGDAIIPGPRLHLVGDAAERHRHVLPVQRHHRQVDLAVARRRHGDDVAVPPVDDLIAVFIPIDDVADSDDDLMLAGAEGVLLDIFIVLPIPGPAPIPVVLTPVHPDALILLPPGVKLYPVRPLGNDRNAVALAIHLQGDFIVRAAHDQEGPFIVAALVAGLDGGRAEAIDIADIEPVSGNGDDPILGNGFPVSILVMPAQAYRPVDRIAVDVHGGRGHAEGVAVIVPLKHARGLDLRPGQLAHALGAHGHAGTGALPFLLHIVPHADGIGAFVGKLPLVAAGAIASASPPLGVAVVVPEDADVVVPAGNNGLDFKILPHGHRHDAVLTGLEALAVDVDVDHRVVGIEVPNVEL